jgi:hypothetical protein
MACNSRLPFGAAAFFSAVVNGGAICYQGVGLRPHLSDRDTDDY